MLAWATNLKREEEKSSFGDNGPTLKWWRGFRERHKELSLRKVEAIDSGRAASAKEDNIQECFDVLEDTMRKNNLLDKPHLLFNYDESALVLNKLAKRVLVPRKSKDCHTIATANTQHMSVLCCVSAAGSTLLPPIVFSKGLPAGRNFQRQGPVNACYSHSDSGFVDRQIYTEWFTKIFLRSAPSERPLLLLQDGASAHLGPDLIDEVIANDVILLCFPPKLTHLLQPDNIPDNEGEHC